MTHLSVIPINGAYTIALARKHKHILGVHPSAMFGLFEGSLFSCRVWLNYDVNKSPLVHADLFFPPLSPSVLMFSVVLKFALTVQSF